MRIAFYGSSLLSAYWNGAATYYRGIIAALARRGYQVTFYEPDVYERQKHRDMEPPGWCRSVVYKPTPAGLKDVAARAGEADVVIKASGVGWEDDAIFDAVLAAAAPHALKIYWDVDAPATLAEVAAAAGHPLRRQLREIDMVLTYGGGDPVIYGFRALGVAECVPVYNALDPSTHHPMLPQERFRADISFLGNRLPDREARVDEFFFRAAGLSPGVNFLLGGSGWQDKPMSRNVRYVGHVGTADHNAFNCTPLAVLNVSRESMAVNGFSPATRVFEAAGAGACLVTDSWAGVDLFLRPGTEVLVARDGSDVAEIMRLLTPAQARLIGTAGRDRVLREHTYDRRADQLDRLLKQAVMQRLEAAE